MYIPSNSTNILGVSLIKKNNKISICLAKNTNSKVEPIFNSDKEFPFNNPLVSSDAVKIFEFIIESNNLIKRLNEQGKIEDFLQNN